MSIAPAHDPPKCLRFGDKILRLFLTRARSDAKPRSLLLIALGTDGAAIPNENAAPIVSAMQFVRGLRDHTSLITPARQFVFAGLAAAVAAGDRGGAIGRAAGDFIELHLAGKTVVEADDRHAKVQLVGDDRKQRGLLAAMLGRARGEGAADLAVQGALGPEAAGLIEEVRHLRRHPAEARAGADDDGVVIGKLFD